jgi:hypothetical protein
MAQIVMDNIFMLHGVPNSIVFDRYPTFTGNFWKEPFKIHVTQLHLNIAYHPQTNGHIEVVNKCLETYLRCFSSERKNRWAQSLPLATWWYNTSYNTSTCMTPSEEVYGQTPPSFLSYIPRLSKVQAVEKILHSVRLFFVLSKTIWSWIRIAQINKHIKVILNTIFLKGTMCFFEYNLIHKLHSKLNTVINLCPNFMVLIQFSCMWDRWPISYLYLVNQSSILFFMFPS